MKMGLSMVLVGHVNFLLGALVHGAVLRHINLNTRAHTVAYSISNIMALTTGLVGVVVGMLAILLSKNKKSRVLTWLLFVVSLFGSLLATASAIGLTVSVVRVTVNGGRSLLTHCRFPNAIGYASITNECPFDHTRVYSMTLILWVPLIVICFVQLVLSVRCFSVGVSFLGLPCFPRKIRLRDHGRTINTVAPAEPPSLTSSVSGHPLHLHLLQSDPPHLKSQRQPFLLLLFITHARLISSPSGSFFLLLLFITRARLISSPSGSFFLLLLLFITRARLISSPSGSLFVLSIRIREEVQTGGLTGGSWFPQRNMSCWNKVSGYNDDDDEHPDTAPYPVYIIPNPDTTP
ncbi:keratinocyte-associated protein 3-like isoform X2 [Oncorhynchus nerka]